MFDNIRKVRKSKIALVFFHPTPLNCDRREKNSRQTNRYKIHETNLAIHNDNQCHATDKDDKRRKVEYLNQFRDENKRLMELREEQRKIQVVIEHGREREILRYNPINWSCSLK